MNKENCALKLVDEIILYYDARSKKHQNGKAVFERRQYFFTLILSIVTSIMCEVVPPPPISAFYIAILGPSGHMT